MKPIHQFTPAELIQALLSIGSTFKLSGRTLKKLRRQLQAQLS